MQPRISGFRGEFLWELDVPQVQLLALADAFPAELYGWRPTDGARSFSEVLVHVAAGNFGLLRLVGVRLPDAELHGPLEGDVLAQIIAMAREGAALEKAVTEKPAVIDLLRRSFEAVRKAFTEAGEAELDRTGPFFGEETTVRRVYLRMLAHSHEHMGQAIAYVRANGIRAPWPDPREELDRMAAARRESRAASSASMSSAE